MASSLSCVRDAITPNIIDVTAAIAKIAADTMLLPIKAPTSDIKIKAIIGGVNTLGEIEENTLFLSATNKECSLRFVSLLMASRRLAASAEERPISKFVLSSLSRLIKSSVYLIDIGISSFHNDLN